MTTTIETIEGNQIPKLKFQTKDVLTTDKDKNKREILLQQALTKGNSYEPEQANIIFRCNEGLKKVKGEVIAITRANITLKGFNKLPIKSIIGLKMDTPVEEEETE